MFKIYSKKIIIIFSLAAIMGLASWPLVPQSVFAQEKAPYQSTQQRCTAYENQFQLSTTTNASTAVNIIGSTQVFCSGTQAALWVIKLLLGFSGATAIVFLIFGGYLYLTSGGSDEQAEKGKKVLVNSIIGLVVIIMSTAIVTIVSSTLALK